MNIFDLQDAVIKGDNETVKNILVHWCDKDVFSTLGDDACILLSFVEELKNHDKKDDFKDLCGKYNHGCCKPKKCGTEQEEVQNAEE